MQKKEVIADSNNQTDKAMDYPMDQLIDLLIYNIICIYLSYFSATHKNILSFCTYRNACLMSLAFKNRF